MKINIRAYGEPLQVLSIQNTVELKDKEVLKDLIVRLESRIGSKNMLLSRYASKDSTLTILVNGRNIQTLDDLKTRLKDGNTVTFILLVVGG